MSRYSKESSSEIIRYIDALNHLKSWFNINYSKNIILSDSDFNDWIIKNNITFQSGVFIADLKKHFNNWNRQLVENS